MGEHEQLIAALKRIKELEDENTRLKNAYSRLVERLRLAIPKSLYELSEIAVNGGHQLTGVVDGSYHCTGCGWNGFLGYGGELHCPNEVIVNRPG